MDTKEIAFQIFEKLPHGIEFLKMLSDECKCEILDWVLWSTMNPKTKRGTAFADMIYQNIRQKKCELTIEKILEIPITPDEFPEIEKFFMQIFREKIEKILDKTA